MRSVPDLQQSFAHSNDCVLKCLERARKRFLDLAASGRNLRYLLDESSIVGRAGWS